MASELCKACEVGRNCINGRFCPPRRQYVEHQDIKECNDKQKKLRRLKAERKKLERINPEAQASIFRDPKAAEHFKWLAERVKKKKEQSLNHSR